MSYLVKILEHYEIHNPKQITVYANDYDMLVFQINLFRLDNQVVDIWYHLKGINKAFITYL